MTRKAMHRTRLARLIQPQVNYSQLAREYGCTPAFVSHIATGRAKAPARFKALCSERLGLPVSVIFPEDED